MFFFNQQLTFHILTQIICQNKTALLNTAACNAHHYGVYTIIIQPHPGVT